MIDKVLVPGTASIETAELVNVTVYPNPAVDMVTVASDNEINAIQVIDVTGKIVLTTTDSTFSVAGLDAGMYTIRVVGQAGDVVKNILKK